MKYIIKKKNKVLEVIETSYPFKGYKFKPKSDNIKGITIVDEKLIGTILNVKINNMFTRLLMIVNDAFNSDDNPTGVSIALDEISLVRETIKIKYAKYLKKEKAELYLKKLSLIEEEMKYKYYAMQESYVHEEKKGKGR